MSEESDKPKKVEAVTPTQEQQAAGMWGPLLNKAASRKARQILAQEGDISTPSPGAHVIAFNLDNPLQCIGPFASMPRAHEEIDKHGWLAADIYECEHSSNGYLLGKRVQRVDSGPRSSRPQRSAFWNQTAIRHERLKGAAEAMQLWHVLNVDELRLLLQATAHAIAPSPVHARLVPDEPVLQSKQALLALLEQLPDPIAAMRPRLAGAKRVAAQAHKPDGTGASQPQPPGTGGKRKPRPPTMR
jgi:hypothetical protein